MTMKGIDKKYIDVLQQFGFHLYTTETGYKLCYNSIGGTFSANFNDENFVENLINFAETFVVCKEESLISSGGNEYVPEKSI